MLPAEKTHYRKGLALGLTLAETFSVVVFVLLLACALLLRTENESRVEAEEQLDEAKEQLGEVETESALAAEMLHRGDTSGGSWYRYAQELKGELEDAQDRAEQAEAELGRERRARLPLDSTTLGPREVADSLVERPEEAETAREFSERADSLLQTAEAERDSLERRLHEERQHVDAVTEAQRLREIVGDAVAEQHDSLAPVQVDSVVARAARTDLLVREVDSLAQELKRAHEAVRIRSGQLRDLEKHSAVGTADSLVREIDRWRFRSDSAELARADAVSRAEYREAQIDSLTQGRGVDPPPCWTEGQVPQHIFRVELTDGGMRLYRVDAPERYANDEAALYATSEIEDGQEYSPAEFLDLTEPIYRMGLDRTDAFGEDGCRFWVEPVDMTGESKDVFKERTDELWQRFWFRW